MKLLVIVALATHAAAADPHASAVPPNSPLQLADLTPSLVGPPSIGFVMEPPKVDLGMVMTPPDVDRDIVIGPPRDLFGRLGRIADAFVDALHQLVPPTL